MIFVTTYFLSYLVISQNFLGISSSSSGAGGHDGGEKRPVKEKAKPKRSKPKVPTYTYRVEAENFREAAQRVTGASIRLEGSPCDNFTSLQQPFQTPIRAPAAGPIELRNMLDSTNPVSLETASQHYSSSRIQTRSDPILDILAPPFILDSSEVPHSMGPGNTAFNQFSTQLERERFNTPRPPRHNYGTSSSSTGKKKLKSSSQERKKKSIIIKGKRGESSGPSDSHAENEWHDFPPFDPDFLEDPPHKEGHQPPHP